MDAGQQVKDFLEKHSENQYLVIVEGQASANSEKMYWPFYCLLLSIGVEWQSVSYISEAAANANAISLSEVAA